jgi:uncharacterized protein (DUF1499 family)
VGGGVETEHNVSYLIVIIALIVILLLAGRIGLLSGKQPQGLGVTDGKLKRLPRTPNCVSSQADLWKDSPQWEYARIEPLALQGDGPATMAKLARIIEAMPGAKLVERKSDYLYAQFTTAMMKYVDDVELWFDPQTHVVHVRSASRVGRKDFGVNRARVEAIREQLLKA